MHDIFCPASASSTKATWNGLVIAMIDRRQCQTRARRALSSSLSVRLEMRCDFKSVLHILKTPAAAKLRRAPRIVLHSQQLFSDVIKSQCITKTRTTNRLPATTVLHTTIVKDNEVGLYEQYYVIHWSEFLSCIDFFLLTF